ncbi:MAG: TonB-dependent receptor [Mucinivorans sp.]
MRWAVVMALIGLLPPAMAQQKEFRIAPVTVTAERTVSQKATTTTLIDSAAMAESVNLSFDELLTKHSPIFVKSYGQGSTATVSFRGTAASHTQVEWNGLNINSPMLGQVDFSMIPVWMVDRTKLLHGGSSLSEGSGALGGSVMIGSRPRWDKKIYGSLMQTAGSFGNLQSSVSLGGGSSKIQARVRYIYQQSRGDFKFLNTAVPPFEYQRQVNAQYNKHIATTDLFWKVGRGHMLSINAWFHTSGRNLPPIMSYEGKGRDEWQGDEEYRVVARWDCYFSKFHSSLYVGYVNTKLDYSLANATDMGLVVNNDSRSRAQNLQAKYKLDYSPTQKTTVVAMVDMALNNVRTLNHITQEGYGATRTDVGVSLTLHQQIAKGVSGFALLRYENNGALMPSLGIEYEPIKNLRLKLNGTRNYHRPTLNDLHWLPGGNPDLEPERGYTADLGAQYTFSDHLSVGLTGYVSWIDNWIIWQPSEYRYWTASNLKTVYARGAEFNFAINYTFGRWHLALHGNYAYTRTTNQKSDKEDDSSLGCQLIYTPVHKANLMAQVDFRGFYLNYNWSYVSQRYTTSSNQETHHDLPAYDIHNIIIGKTIHKFDLQIRIDNLFNKDYQAILWRAMPPRSYTALLRFNF